MSTAAETWVFLRVTGGKVSFGLNQVHSPIRQTFVAVWRSGFDENG